MEVAEGKQKGLDLEGKVQKASRQGQMEVEGDGAGGGQRGEKKKRARGRSYHDTKPHMKEDRTSVAMWLQSTVCTQPLAWEF